MREQSLSLQQLVPPVTQLRCSEMPQSLAAELVVCSFHQLKNRLMHRAVSVRRKKTKLATPSGDEEVKVQDGSATILSHTSGGAPVPRPRKQQRQRKGQQQVCLTSLSWD